MEPGSLAMSLPPVSSYLKSVALGTIPKMLIIVSLDCNMYHYDKRITLGEFTCYQAIIIGKFKFTLDIM